MRRTLFGLTIAIATTAAVADHRGDFNGDGFDDLAIGVSNQWVSGKAAAGAVHVMEGHIGRLSGVMRYLHEKRPGFATAAATLIGSAGCGSELPTFLSIELVERLLPGRTEIG